ncbi:MAG: winged helix-turn-helix transcriptional regulator [Candidatus Woesebacteria bacterium]|nr:MAG: winged helix-turn-helix transcriptional regulator [Candidatus Woesebacteria bacterium]
MVTNKLSYTPKVYEQMAELFKAIANSKRLEILSMTMNFEVTVNELSKVLKVRKSNTSQHLKILRLTGLVKSRRQGKNIFYKVTNPQIKSIFEVTGKST